MRHLLRLPLAAAWLCLLAGPTAPASAAPKTEWRVKVKEDKDGNPHSKVDLVINDEQAVHLVSPDTISKYIVLARDDYAEHKVPARALCACTSWWAGSGTKFYVVATSEGNLELFRQDLDEGAADAGYRKVRTVKVESP